MDDMCTACLCTGRKLYFIGETGHYHLYSQILNEIPVYDFSDVCVRVCWECRAVLRRFGEFKALVKRSYNELLQQVHQNIPPNKQSLVRAPHLQIQHVINLCYPENEVKEETCKDKDGLEGLPPDLEDIPEDLDEMPPSIEDVDVQDEFKVEPDMFAEACDSEQVKTKKRKKMPMTAAERQKKYIEKLKRENPEKYGIKRKQHLQKIPLTAAERQKKYIEKLKRENPEKYEIKRKQHLQKVKDRQKKKKREEKCCENKTSILN